VIFNLPSSELDESLEEMVAFETILRRCFADSPSSVGFFFSSFSEQEDILHLHMYIPGQTSAGEMVSLKLNTPSEDYRKGVDTACNNILKRKNQLQ